MAYIVHVMVASVDIRWLNLTETRSACLEDELAPYIVSGRGTGMLT
jgi:hypothetical protein